MTHFEVVCVVADNAGADIFIDTCNQSEVFKNAKINIKLLILQQKQKAQTTICKSRMLDRNIIYLKKE